MTNGKARREDDDMELGERRTQTSRDATTDAQGDIGNSREPQADRHARTRSNRHVFSPLPSPFRSPSGAPKCWFAFPQYCRVRSSRKISNDCVCVCVLSSHREQNGKHPQSPACPPPLHPRSARAPSPLTSPCMPPPLSTPLAPPLSFRAPGKILRVGSPPSLPKRPPVADGRMHAIAKAV